MVGVGQQREVQLVLRAEIAVRLFAVGTHADDAESAAGQLIAAVAQTFGLERTSRSVVLGIEIEDDALPPKVRKRQGFTLLRGRFEIGGHIPGP